MKFRHIRSDRTPYLSMAIGAFFLLLLSCGGGDPSVNSTSDTGAINFRINFQQAGGNIQPQAAVLDCAGIGVSTIEARVYDENTEHLVNGGPWDCDAGQGTITAVKVGSNRTIVLVGRDADGNGVYRGEKTITVIAGSSNSAGTIDCTPFFPIPLTPTKGSRVQVDDFKFIWNAVDGAAEYWILVSENEDVSNPIIDDTTTETSYIPSGLSYSTTYYWQVHARDSYDLTAGSSIWSITTDENTIAAGGNYAAGGRYSVALKSDGTLWTWGQNEKGQLGLGDTNDRSTATQVGTDNDWDTVWAGWDYAVAKKTDGTLWAWGNNEYGQLGLGDTDDRSTPTQVGTGSDWDAFICGFYHTLAKKTDGTLWVWGANGSGQLGLGDTTDRPSPVQFDPGSDWKSIWAGGHYMLMKKADGTDGTFSFWVWGSNLYGQLGLGDTNDRDSPTLFGDYTEWETIWLGGYHTLAKKTDGTLWTWGRNDNGQLGLGDRAQRDTPAQVGTGTDWGTVWTGGWHTLAEKTDGTLWVWGRNFNGQLGLGDTDDRDTPTSF